MKKQTALILHSLVFILLLPAISFAQLISTDPAFPTSGDYVLLTFDATQGSGGLAGYDGDVYAHTGVITSESTSGSDWKYVKTSWGQNTPETKLARIDDDLYTLEITPDIRDYYGVPQDEDILQMAFVFRSSEQVGGSWLEGKTETGDDIFVTVYEAGLNVFFSIPEQNELLVEASQEIPIEVFSSYADSILIYHDDILIFNTDQEFLSDTIVAEPSGEHWIKAIAKTDTGMVADSFYYYVREAVVIEELPEGMRDGINYIDENTVILTLLAPGKDFVYVVGDFNSWVIDNTYQMKMTPDGERFWLELGDLIPQQEYIYQYLVDGSLKIADPFTEKTSDPWNDHYISEQVYPGLIDYPSDKTTGIASVLQTAQEPYNWEVENFTPAPVEQLVIYELLIRDFTSSHTYQALTDTLGYLKNLGVTAIELMPVNEFEGNSSWGYNPSFYFAPDKYYGHKNNLKEFIDECHKSGIAVIIDMVLNHSYDQSPFVQLYFDGSKPTEDNPWYNRDHNFTNPDAQWGNDFNHESIYTQQLIDSINSFWMNEYKADGFRFDFTKGFGNNIKGSNDPWGSNYDADRIALLKRMANEIWARNHDALVILEHLAVNQEEKELADYGMLMWGNTNYNYGEAMMGYHSGSKSDFSWISYQERGWSDPHVVGYMESHDEERLIFKNYSWGNSSGDYNTKDTTIALERMGMAASFFYTIPGPKMIWQFGEMGYDYSIDYNGRLGEKPVRWDYYQDYRRKYLYNVISSLIDLKKEHAVFATEDFYLGVSGAVKRITLSHEDMNVCIVGNFDLVEGSIVPGFQHTGTWYDFFKGDSVNIAGLNEAMTLQPGEYHLFTDIRLDTPEIGTGIINPESTAENELISAIYPNPSTGTFNIVLGHFSAPVIELSIMDFSGREIINLEKNISVDETQTISFSLDDHIAPGFYLISISDGTIRDTEKIVKF